jgi:hypothetical protein
MSTSVGSSVIICSITVVWVSGSVMTVTVVMVGSDGDMRVYVIFITPFWVSVVAVST